MTDAPSDAMERDIERDAAYGLDLTTSSSHLSTVSPSSPSRRASNSGKKTFEDIRPRDWDLSPSAGVNRAFEWPSQGVTSSSRNLEEQISERAEELKLNIRERLRHFTWTWFTMTMATGGIANVLYTVPYRFHGLFAIGCIFFLFNIVLFVFNCIMICFRFYLYPATFRASFLHPTESLFIPASIISTGTILINITQYGFDIHKREWLLHAMGVFYWIYCAFAILFSSGIYLTMWSTQTFTIEQMTPIWIFPAYPLLIVGPFAGNLARKLASINPTHTLEILIGGYTLQGIGFLVSLMIYSSYIYRLMTKKLPRECLRPGMFISVGPSGFTIAGLINMASQLPAVVPPAFMGIDNGALAAKISVVAANWAGLWLWGLAFWFFLVSVGAHASCAAHGRLDFAMTWYSFVFPNTALTTATFAIANALDGNRGIRILGCVLALTVIIVWVFVFVSMIRAVVNKHILWPQKQEDRVEGGWEPDTVKEKNWDTFHRDRRASIADRVLVRVATMTKRSVEVGRYGDRAVQQ